MTADPKAVLQAAVVASAGVTDEAVILYEEARYILDLEGRCDYRYRLAYRIQTDAGAARWSSISAEWAPWYQQRPELRARVITPEGVAHPLDPATIAEAGVGEEDPEIFSDRRLLRAPLPAARAGAVVEEEIRIIDHAPLLPSDAGQRFVFGSSVAVARTLVSVDAPETLPLKHVLRGIDGLTVERQREAGRLRLIVEADGLKPASEPEPWMPGDRPRAPYFAFSTSPSWAAVASRYGRVVDTQIGVGPVAALRTGVRREEISARLLKRLHEEVRYTGVEFGEAAVVPRSPAEVMSRRYGDCKDKSALLVSRLRNEGIPAFIALLSARFGSDIDPELPSLSGFNHAIVVLPGDPTLWIDPTEEFARVNELPAVVQGRLALVAAEGTQELLRTPTTTSADNVLRKTREYKLAESGGGQVVETARPTGSVERSYRSYYANSSPDKRRESQEKYARSEHGASAVLSVRNTEPRDVSVPFEVKVESQLGTGEEPDLTATVTIAPAGLFARLPDAVTDEPEDGDLHKQRQQPFVVVEPHRVEWTYRIVLPPGFVVKRLPEAEKASLGLATLETRFEERPDGSVEGLLSFDSGPPLLQPREFEAMRDGVRRWSERELTVELQDGARALLESGRTCDAISQLRKTIERQPTRALPHAHLAEALLQTGLGEAAREEARQAVLLEPTSATAHRVLGWTLEHDALGRRFKKGWDRADAEAAYRKAKELDPKSVLARTSLAILHEHNDQGVQFGEGARLEEAIREAQALRADLEDARLDTNRLLGLMWLRRFDEIERSAWALPEEVNRNEILLVAAAALRGTRQAATEAAKLFPDPAQRRDAFLHAGNSLVQLRLYAEGAALLAEAVPGAEDAAARRSRADLFARVKRYENLDLPEDDPRSAAKRLFIVAAETMAGIGDPGALAQLMELSDVERAQSSGEPAAHRRALLAAARHVAGSGVQLTQVITDVVLSVASFVAEGDPEGGYRVRVRMGDRSQAIYVVRSSGRHRILGSDKDPVRVAAEIWRLVDAGQVAGAARWLDWLREDIDQKHSVDPIGGPALVRLWRADGPRDADTARIAAASLLWSKERVEQGIDALSAGRERLSSEAARQDVDVALLQLHAIAQQRAALATVAKRLSLAFPTSAYSFEVLVESLAKLGRTDEARAACDERLREKPGDVLALRGLTRVESIAGRYEAAEKAFTRIAELGRTEPMDWNNRAWNAALRGTVDDAAIDWGQRAIPAQGRGDAASLHTLATLYAEKGRVKEAQQVLAESLAMAEDEPASQDWYVVGRIAEECGLVEIARQAYAKVEHEEGELESTGMLAQRALVRLPEPDVGKRAKRAGGSTPPH